MKEPKCKLCGKLGHYKTWCPTSVRKPIKQTSIKKPTYKEAVAKPFKARQQPSSCKMVSYAQKQGKPLKRPKIAPKSNSYRATLIRNADRVLSTYIRRKDAVNDIARCVTCGKIDHYKNMQNGHYIGRRHMKLRYDIRNVHVQCPKCNMELGGNLANYKSYLLERYGTDILLHFNIVLQAGGKITNSDLQAIIDKYTEKLKNL